MPLHDFPFPKKYYPHYLCVAQVEYDLFCHIERSRDVMIRFSTALELTYDLCPEHLPAVVRESKGAEQNILKQIPVCTGMTKYTYDLPTKQCPVR